VRPQVEILEDKADLAAQAVDLAVVGGDQVAVFLRLELEGSPATRISPGAGSPAG